ncbi:MAG TPA: bifunctional 5,10-methylenetetrahydrofolate dehydrogenase/5,10-methenyltetrahydrofolate cyclohydrolase [Pyrinomonadaceae bacterium]|nr:bifunctional 5,10-methylenetetrahydrofolate dehydrogenase/5,10-methenyltetrahydrofolate cyclohydrolase [Pyrinomonadaceae bacterium]
MPARILSGREIAEAIKAEVSAAVARLRDAGLTRPGLAAIRVGEDPASGVYVASKVATAGDLGIYSESTHLPVSASSEEIADLVESLNGRDDIDGILVQLPLPGHIREQDVLERIDPTKDVDGFHPVNAGRLSQGYPSLRPCTPTGVIEILKRSNIEIAGQHSVVVGRSNIVGKPMAMLMLAENATVTICHSRTANLAEITRQADILIAAIGRPGFIRAEHIGEGSTVVDVGINRLIDMELAAELFEAEMLEKRLTTIAKRGFTLVGDVSPADAMRKAANFTPVPGGVGLLTVAMLMRNTADAAAARRKRLGAAG